MASALRLHRCRWPYPLLAPSSQRLASAFSAPLPTDLLQPSRSQQQQQPPGWKPLSTHCTALNVDGSQFSGSGSVTTWEEQQHHYRASLAATTSSQLACPFPSLKPGISFEQRGVQQLERLVRDRMRSKLHKKQILRNRQDRCNVHMQSGSGKPGGSDENKVKLGHTLRILQDRLPTLLQSPLPQHILAPNISLHLFPSTHPHLPTVSGRVAYTAALWTSPIAWNRVPLVGNVRVDIVSERMMKEPLAFAPRRDGALLEQLVVRWRTVPDGDGTNSGGEGMLSSVGRGKAAGLSTPSQTASGTRGDEDFTGLYIFQFDGEGRILSHTIELAQAGGRWEQGVGAKVVGLTDWLLGEIKGKPDSGSACPAFERPEER